MISVIIPVRPGGHAGITLASLGAQTFRDFEIVISPDVSGLPDNRGANWARNHGAAKARGEYLLFSDDDIRWEPDALKRLWRALENDRLHREPSFAYGPYDLIDAGGHATRFCDREFSADRLRRGSFISTMSLVRRDHFPGFDESLGRLQDWDLWLTMSAAGHTGAYCGPEPLFSTHVRPGITLGAVSWREARNQVAAKHKL
jgi:glycosyltransferase involved in cell wall biosynthesis